jgi:hypothetical protein
MSVRHLYENLVRIQRERDKVWFHFQTYRLSHSEWGYELVRADGHACSSVSDPDYPSERAVIEAIQEHVEKFERIPGTGWCVVTAEERAAVGIPR